MKILMVTSNYDDRILALLEFKKLNIAHSIDFVSNGNELGEYLNNKMIGSNEWPNLVLINSISDSHEGPDALGMITSHPEWAKLNVIVFSTFSNLSDIIMKNEDVQPLSQSSDMELSWILREICNGLATKEGWQYQLKTHGMKKRALA